MQDGQDSAAKRFSCDIQEYSSADLLVGVHGAGLTHMVGRYLNL